MKYNELNLGQIEAIVNRFGGMEGVERFLRGELSIVEVPPKWTEKDGVIYFDVTSDGTTGEQWIARIEGKGFQVANDAKQLFRSSDFKPTTGVTTRIAVLRASLFSKSDRVTHKIQAKAEGVYKFTKPNAESACLTWKKFSNEELKKMGLWWLVFFHEPIKDSNGDPRLLGTPGIGDDLCFSTYCSNPGGLWGRNVGFAFSLGQV